MTNVASTIEGTPPPIVAQVAALQQTMQGVGPTIAGDAATGDFAGILTSLQTLSDQLAGRTTTAPAGSQGAGTTDPTTLGASDQLASSASIGSFALNGGSSLTASTPGGGVTGSAVVSDAAKYLGVPYQWGGTSTTTGFDCSGLVQHVYGDLGISLPRTSQEQATVGQPVDSLADAQPGDLLFFEPGASGPGHVGIYIGNGQMIDAPHTGTDVQVQSVSTTPCAIRRILPAGTSTAGVGATDPGSPSSSAGAASASLHVPATLAPLFLSAGAEYGVSPQLLASVAQVESNFDPSAVSSAGAEGLMQIMPDTAQGLGVNPFDPQQAIDGAAQILAGNLKQFGSVPLALAAYNAGAGAVEQYGGIPPYDQTQDYVTKIMGLMGATAT